jgi:hypothetical protein
MIQYNLDYTIEKILKEDLIAEQKILEDLTGKILPKNEAVNVWQKIQDHKWHISERLSRDVGLRVAAVDYIENFYGPNITKNRNSSSRMRRALLAATLAS